MSGARTVMSVTLGEGVAVVRRQGRTDPIVAGVLGIERTEGVETVYLDRVVHGAGQDWQEWDAAGAVSTILSRPMVEAEQAGSPPVSVADEAIRTAAP